MRIPSFYFTVSPILGVCFSVGGCSFEFEQSFDPRPLFFLDRHTEEAVAVVGLFVHVSCFSCGSRTVTERKYTKKLGVLSWLEIHLRTLGNVLVNQNKPFIVIARRSIVIRLD